MDYLERIEKYHNELYSNEEKKEFESDLKKNETLKKEYDDFQLLLRGVRAKALRKELNKISATQSKSDSNKQIKVRKLNSFHIISIAASLLLLLGFFFFQNKTKPTSITKDFTSLYYSDPGLPVVMGETSEIKFSEAMNQYKLGNYEISKSTFNEHCESLKEKKSCYYLAQCFLNLKEYDLAISQFEKLINNENDIWKQKSEWYCAYALWISGDQKYNSILASIRKQKEHMFYEEALQLE